MDLQTYSERAKQIVHDCGIAVMVLLSQDGSDLEMLPLRPRPLPASELPTAEAFTARRLRPVGIIGLCGTRGMCAFKELLSEAVVAALGVSFGEYVHALIGDRVAAQLVELQKGDEVSWIEQLHKLPDTRD